MSCPLSEALSLLSVRMTLIILVCCVLSEDWSKKLILRSKAPNLLEEEEE